MVAVLLVGVAIAVLLLASPLVAAAAACGIGVACLFVRYPRLAATCWLLVLVLVPHWIGIQVATVYLPPISLVGLLCLPAAALGGRWRPSKVDFFLLCVLVLATWLTISLNTGRTMWAAMITQWALAYLLGRGLGRRLGGELVGQMVLWAMLLAAAGSVVEASFNWHPFVGVGLSSPEAQWAEIIYRGGFARSEGAMGHPIALGGAIAMAIPFAMVGPRRGSVLKLIVLLGGIACTLSRGPLISTGLTIALVLWAERRLTTGRRLLIVIMGVLVVVAVAPIAGQIYNSDSAAIAASSNTRSTVFGSALSDLHPAAAADYTQTGLDGTFYYRGFTTIDDTFLSIAVRFGWVLAALLFIPLFVVLLRSLRRRVNLAEMSLVGQIPTLLTVALITQYAGILWFMAGLAVSWAAANGLGRRVVDDARPAVRRPRARAGNVAA